jgi:PKD repeat protein
VLCGFAESAKNRAFLVDLPNGTYTVVPTLGAYSCSQTQVSIWLNNQQVASGLSTAAKQFISPAYQATVTSGQLSVDLQNMSGGWFYLAALSVLPGSVQPPTVNPGPTVTADAASPVTFRQATAGGTGPLTYNWYFGDTMSGSSTSAALNPTYTYRTAGTDTAILTVTDANDLVVAGPAITVNAGSPASFSQATVTGGTSPYSSSWSFGDGSQGSTTLHPTHTYQNPGKYTASLTATDSINATDTGSATVTVNDVPPTVTMTLPSAARSGIAFNVSAAANDISPAVQAAGYTYLWNFGDGTAATGASTSHVYGAPGTYTVSVTATDDYGHSGTTTGSLSVGKTMATTYTLTAPNPADCATGVPSAPFTIGLPFGQFVSGPVTVTLSDARMGGTIAPSTVVLSNSSPTATFTYTAARTGTISISAQDNGGLTNPAPVSITAQSPVTTYTVSGPSSGTVATAATFTVSLGSGWLSSPVTINASADNGDGAFSPASVTLSMANPSATITYTPRLYDARHIVFTNGGELTDPAPLAFLSEVQLGSSGTANSGNQAPDLGGFDFFTDGAWWQAIGSPASDYGIAPNSSSLISGFGAATLRLVVQTTTANGGNSLVGLPYNVVPGNQLLVPVELGTNAGQSTANSAPFYSTMSIEGVQGPPPAFPPSADMHGLVMVRNETTGGIAYLYDGFMVGWDSANNSWKANALSEYDLTTGTPGPEFWTSSNAAGLPESPLLLSYSEAALAAAGGPAIDHPLLAAISAALSMNRFVWPARHAVYSGSPTSGLPMGARLALSPSWYDANINKFDPIDRAVVTAMFNYGVIVTDLTNGGGIWLGGVNDQRWTICELSALGSIPDSAFQVLNTIQSPISFTGPTSGTVGTPQTFSLAYLNAADSNFSTYVFIFDSADGGKTWSTVGRFALNDSSRGPFTATFTPKAAGTYIFTVSFGGNLWIQPPNITFTATTNTNTNTTLVAAAMPPTAVVGMMALTDSGGPAPKLGNSRATTTVAAGPSVGSLASDARTVPRSRPNQSTVPGDGNRDPASMTSSGAGRRISASLRSTEESA